MTQSRRRARRSFVLLAAILTAALLTACGDDDDDAAAAGAEGSEEPIKIAYPNAQSGFLAFFDIAVQRGMELAIEDVNADGGVLGRPLELLLGPDNKSDFNYTRDAAVQALEADPDVLVTSCDYDFGSPQALAANEEGVLALGCAGGTGYGLEGIGPLTFNTDSANPTSAAVLGQFTAENFPNAYFVKDTSIVYSEEMCDLGEPVFESAGGTVVGRDTFANGDTSFAAQINRFRQDGTDADALVLCSYPPGGANFLKAFRAAGFDTPVVGANAFGGSSWFEQVPEIGEFYAAGDTGSLNGDDPDERKNDLLARYEEKYGEEPTNALFYVGYSTIELLVRAIEKAESTDAEELASAIESFENEPLLVGETTYTDDCHIPLGRGKVVTQVVGDEAQFLEHITPNEVDRSRC